MSFPKGKQCDRGEWFTINRTNGEKPKREYVEGTLRVGGMGIHKVEWWVKGFCWMNIRGWWKFKKVTWCVEGKLWMDVDWR